MLLDYNPEAPERSIPLTHSRHACRHSLFTSHNQHRRKNTNCCVKWKVSKMCERRRMGVYAMQSFERMRESAAWKELLSRKRENRDKCVLMNLAVNFSIALRKFIAVVGDASSGVSLIVLIFPPLLRRKIQLSAVLSTGCWCLIKREVNDNR